MATPSLPDHYLIPHLLLLLLLLLCILSNAQTISSSISPGSSLSTLVENNRWVSPSGDFAFGFHPPGDNTTNTVFLLAISFNKILTDQTIVWFAKDDGDNPVQVKGGSKLEFMKDGSLVLTDENGQERWTADGGNASYAAMLDNGNFVLSSSSSVHTWQSFENPTDTILPTQQLQRRGKLSSCKSDTDFSTGRFQLRLLPDSNLVLNTISLPSRNSFAYERYWITVDTIDTNTRVVFEPESGVIVMRANGSAVNVTFGYLESPRDYYQRARLDPDGVFRHYVYKKTDHGSSWTMASFIPENICTAAIFKENGGSGPCGFNSYCRFTGSSRSICECPDGYSYSDPTNPRNGCSPDFDSWSCKPESVGGLQTGAPLFDMRELGDTDWPTGDYERMDSIGVDGCRNACLSDCACAVAIYRGGSCWKKKYPLSNGRVDPSIGGKALIKVPKENTSPSQILISPDQRGSKDGSTPSVVVSVLLGISVLINLILLSAIFMLKFFSFRKKHHPSSSKVGTNIRSFTYEELEKATDGFKEELGSGAFGTVYKGAMELVETSRTFVAVKRLDKVVHKGEKEFKSEMNTIGKTHHKNLVQLLGFCDQGLHRLLVYEYMSNGSLASFLFGSSKHNLNQRLQIALGIARGLLYLHDECSTQIIHCDIKPQNILLDENFTARISDFGLAKLLSTDQSRTSTSIRGTKGYVAPEWFRNTAVTARVDVYSFGVILLEIICRRKNVDMGQDGDEKVILTDWADDCYRGGRLGMLVGDDEEVMGDGPRLETLVPVALWCIQEDPSLRPSMKKVIQMLEGAVEVPVPPPLPSFLT